MSPCLFWVLSSRLLVKPIKLREHTLAPPDGEDLIAIRHHRLLTLYYRIEMEML